MIRQATNEHARTLRTDRQRGIALLLVITVLVTLVLIAVPFSMSMRKGHERTVNENARARAAFEADLLLGAMKHALATTHPSQEQERSQGAEGGVDADASVDSLAEISLGDEFRERLEESWLTVLDKDENTVRRQETLRVRGLGPMNDDHGSIWTGVVEDANARIHPEGASPFLMAGLMGSALLSEALDASAPDIPVEYVSSSKLPGVPGFPRDGGYIRIGNEVIRYSKFDGSTFRDCERGALPETPLGDNGDPQEHEQGTPVIDYMAYKMATHLIAARPGFLSRFSNLDSLRAVGGWGAGALPADRLDPFKPFFTVWSRRETATAWLAPQVVTNELPTSSDGSTPDEVIVKDLLNPTGTTAYLNPGSLVRITDGIQTSYQMVNHLGDALGRQRDRIASLCGSAAAGLPEEGTVYEGGRTIVAALAPRPININTASKEVLYACLVNLHLYGADTPEKIVHPEVAMMVVERLFDERAGALQIEGETGRRARGPFRHSEDYGRFLERLQDEEVITRDQRAALYYNAINPHDWQLAFGTAPWCYRTLDVYHIEARVAVNDGGGGAQVSTAVVREVVEIGSDGRTSWTLDSQEEFEQRLSMGSGGKWIATFPYAMNFRGRGNQTLQPARRPPQSFSYGIYPQTARSGEQDERGEVRLEPARITLPGAMVQHFDSSPFTEGWRTDYSGAFTAKTRGTMFGPDDERCQPFTVAFWWCSYSEANWTAFDCGQEKFLNRYAIFVTDGREGPELVFRVCAATLQERGAEIFVPLQRLGYQPGTWYHIQATCHGEDPSTMELLVDGVAVGTRRSVTWLASGIGEDDTELLVESADGFDQTGALLIGNEIVEYDLRDEEAFRDCFRGARGTGDPENRNVGTAWPAGTPVRQLGYSNAVLIDIMRGGSSLPEVLGEWSALRIDNRDDTIIVSDNQDPPVLRRFAGVKWNEGGAITATVLPLWGQPINDALDAFGTQGIAIMGNNPTSVPNLPSETDTEGFLIYGMELVYYTRSSGGDTLEITRDLDRRWWPQRDEGYSMITWDEDNQAIVPAFLVPISVMGTDSGAPGEDYLDPSVPEELELLSSHGGDGRGRVCLGLPDDDSFSEIIAYDSIERQLASPNMLFVRDRGLNTVFPDENGGSLTGMFFAQAPPDAQEVIVDIPPVEEGLEDPDFAAEVVEGERDERDVDPPVNPVLPEEDPTPDRSGEGENERVDDEEGFPEGIVQATINPTLPGAEWEGGTADYGEPEYTRVRQWIMGQSDEDPTERFAGFRGVLSTHYRRHETATANSRESRYLPVFGVAESWGALNQRVGRNDRVTITDGAAQEPVRVSALIRWSDDRSGYSALDDFLDFRIRGLEQGEATNPWDRRGIPRILKFPCKELPTELPDTMEFAQSSVSSSSVATAYLDEIHMWRHLPAPRAMLSMLGDEGSQVLDAEATEIRIVPQLGDNLERVPGWDQECGILNLDGELIVYRGLRTEGEREVILERCMRGMLGTSPRAHAVGGYGSFVPAIPVGYLDGRVPRDGASLPVVGLDDEVAVWPQEGLVRMLGSDTVELIHYTRRSDQDLFLPEALDADEAVRGRGLLRGRFGTDVADHDAETIVMYQPFRYWDRYMPRRTEEGEAFAGMHAHPAASYVELGKRVRSGYWHRVAWQEGDLDEADSGGRGRGGGGGGGGEATGLLDVVVLGRFSPTVPWDSNLVVDLRGDAEFAAGPSSTEGRPVDRLYVFDDPEAANRLGLESETAEFRVFFVFRSGAFLPQDGVFDALGGEEAVFENAWKRSPSLLDLTLEYTSRTTELARSFLR